MAITSITIENFKGIGDAVTIPIRPITLLFGKNSSGKSTVLQALLYMRELFLRFYQYDTYTRGEREYLPPLKNIPIDLGDFPSLVHRHDLDRKIRIRLRVDRAFSSDENFVEIELVVSWDKAQRIDSVESYIYALNGEDFFYTLNEKGKSYQTDKGQQLRQFDYQESTFSGGRDGKEGYLHFVNKNSSIVKEAENKNSSIQKKAGKAEDGMYSMSINVHKLGFMDCIRTELNSIRYIGPIREVPPRNYLVSQSSNESRWATGLGAWDAVAQDAVLAEKVNRYAQKLKLGYRFLQSDRVFLDMNREIMENLRIICSSDEDLEVDKLKRQVLDPLERLHRQHQTLLLDENRDVEVHPSDVGFGISQVFPVLVGGLDQGANSPKMFMVEQPELHIHPALQVGLGDLFIDGIRLGEGRRMLIETHSEHLLLRIMRRMRETFEDRIEEDRFPVTPDDVAVLFVESHDSRTIIREMPLNERGDLVKAWPGGFFEEDTEEVFA